MHVNKYVNIIFINICILLSIVINNNILLCQIHNYGCICNIMYIDISYVFGSFWYGLFLHLGRFRMGRFCMWAVLGWAVFVWDDLVSGPTSPESASPTLYGL